MEKSSNKRDAGGLMTRRKGFASFEDVADEETPGAQFCNRIGCHGRIKYSQNAGSVLAKSGSMNKPKVPKSSSSTSNGNETIEKSTRSSSVITQEKKPSPVSKRKSSPSNSDPLESSVSSKSGSSPSSRTGYSSESYKSADVMGSECRSPSVSSKVRPRRVFPQKSNIHNQSTPPASAVPLASKSNYRVSSNNMPARNSSLEYFGKMKKRSSEGETSLPRRAVGQTNGASYISTSTSGVRISDSSPCSNSSGGESNRPASTVLPRRSTNDNTRTMSVSRQTGRNTSSVRQPTVGKKPLFNGSGCSSSDLRRSIHYGEVSSSASSVRNRRSTNENCRIQPSSRQNGRNSSSIRQPAVGIPHVPGAEIPSTNGGPNNPVRRISATGWGIPMSINDSPYPSTAMARDLFLRPDELAEALLSLERVGQYGLSHEQMLALERSLYLSSFDGYDQHRDMRMDIDNMSYEELLALEERMGSVSTAVPEEALSNCIKKSSYQPTTSNLQTMECCEDGNDFKCSICQEEYQSGDEIGKLVECHHGYHVECINHWLQMKNWCPVCKASAVPSESS